MGSCYLEVSFGTTGVGNLVLPGVTWSVTWCCLALPTFSFWDGFNFFFCGPKYPRSPNSNFWKEINFHLEVLPGPTAVHVAVI